MKMNILNAICRIKDIAQFPKPTYIFIIGIINIRSCFE